MGALDDLPEECLSAVASSLAVRDLLALACTKRLRQLMQAHARCCSKYEARFPTLSDARHADCSAG